VTGRRTETRTHADGLFNESGGWRRYLRGLPVTCGSQLEMRAGSQWVPVRYEASFRGDVGLRERLYVEPGRCLLIELGSEPELRWRTP
jgi:hypothetical protein